jgi:hypothetical protein
MREIVTCAGTKGTPLLYSLNSSRCHLPFSLTSRHPIPPEVLTYYDCPIVPLQDHARSNEHDTSHQTRGVLSQVESDGGIGGRAWSCKGTISTRSLG